MFESDVIRKENLNGYQAWRLDDFDGVDIKDVPLPTVAELEQIRQTAHAEGYAAGVQEGRHEVQAQGAQLRALLGSMQEALQSLDHQVAQQLLQLALTCAQKVIGRTLEVHPELVVDSVRDAVAELPPFKGVLILELHPLDAEMVRSALASDNDIALGQGNTLTFKTDASLQRGGCRLQTPESAIDASIETRWQRVLAALSLDPEAQADA